MDKFNKKIFKYKNKDIFIVFYSDWCPYSVKALELLKNNKRSFKAYKIDKIRGGMDRLLDNLKRQSKMTQFDKDHTTRPIIFLKGKFIGGHDDLVTHLDMTTPTTETQYNSSHTD